MSSPIKLIVGLGNPGQQYESTRHNAGAWFVEQVSRQFNTSLNQDSKYSGLVGRTNIDGEDVRLLIPTDYMNNSGKSVAPLANFFKIKPEEILVAHDELDLPPGTVRLKQGGGHGGHNGLRDIISCLGNNKNFLRLRIGIGHPGSPDKVTSFVLGKAPSSEQDLIDASLDAALDVTPKVVAGDMQKVMNKLHRFKASK